MTPWLEWGLYTVSLINVILLTWLGLTVLFNAERRDWGIWLAGGAMLLGAALYLFHAVFMSVGAPEISPLLVARWPIAWAAGFALPCAWYAMMLWHAGYWEHRAGMRHHRLHSAVVAVLATLVIVVALVIITFPFPLSRPYEMPYFLYGPVLGTVPVVAIIYGLSILACVVMSLDALACPAPSSRIMGELARRRSRPWLSATSLALLAVGLLVGAALVIFTPTLSITPLSAVSEEFNRQFAVFDLAVSAGVLLAILLLGEGVVAYEIFTGKALPRRGLRRNWRRIVLLAAGYSALVAVSLVANMTAIFGVLLAAGLFSIFFALANWRAFAEHEQYLRHLRAFIAGPPVFDRLLTAPAFDASGLLRACCDDILNARAAALVPLGPFAALIEPLAYPAGAVPEIADQLTAWCDPRVLCFPLDERADGMRWAVPLWSARGRIGVLLLGARRDGGLYTQEEMEIARAAGEHLLDTVASLTMAHRLLQVQRARTAEGQVADRRTRRVLHDEILPQLHTAMLALSAGPEQAPAVLEQLSEVHRAISDVLHAMPAGGPFSAARLASLAEFRQAIETEFGAEFDRVDWEIAPDADARVQALSPLAQEVFFGAAREAVRNAARHARGPDPDRPLHLRLAFTTADGVTALIEDDGVGLDAGNQGAGQGMALHGAMLAVVGGAWTMDSQPGRTCITLSIPHRLVLCASQPVRRS
jgi:signal transduction histidine kinase